VQESYEQMSQQGNETLVTNCVASQDISNTSPSQFCSTFLISSSFAFEASCH